MANYITDIYSNKISCRGLQVRPNRDTMKIVTRMLDGQYSVQQIGTQATTLAVTLFPSRTRLHLTKSARPASRS